MVGRSVIVRRKSCVTEGLGDGNWDRGAVEGFVTFGARKYERWFRRAGPTETVDAHHPSATCFFFGRSFGAKQTSIPCPRQVRTCRARPRDTCRARLYHNNSLNNNYKIIGPLLPVTAPYNCSCLPIEQAAVSHFYKGFTNMTVQVCEKNTRQ